MKEIEHEWHHEMLEIYGAAIEEFLGDPTREVATTVLNKLMKRVSELKMKYEKRERLDAESWIKMGTT